MPRSGKEEMKVIKKAIWIKAVDKSGIIPTFFKNICIDKSVKKAELAITALGVYEVYINGKRVSDYIFAPGWTNYEQRLQYQTYDVSDFFAGGDNLIEVTVGNGWFRGKIVHNKKRIDAAPTMVACLDVTYDDNESECFYSDLSWKCRQSNILFSDIYDGEIYDADFQDESVEVKRADGNRSVLIPQEGEIIKEHERFSAVLEFVTPKGERVLDFGQEITGYVELNVNAKKGDIISLSFAEVLDGDSNFYNDNYRDAKCIYKYICRDGEQTYKPHTTFYGFRYIRIDSAPDNITADNFTAIAVYSDIRKTGKIECGDANINRLMKNVEWGQKDNFLDVPTDCPQRDERLGWTGDAQVFIKTASYFYDVKKFFEKWLNDMITEQRFDGMIPGVIPDVYPVTVYGHTTSPAWGDAAVICPWILYEMYGDKNILKKYMPMMKKWIAYIENSTIEENLWIGHNGYGDWLGLDAELDAYRGATSQDFIGSAYYCHDLDIMRKALNELGECENPYEEKYKISREAFMKRFPKYNTQTEYALVLRFGLTDEKKKCAEELAETVRSNGNHLTTGFVGTPHILFALSENGMAKTAYDLLLQEDSPSWLYSVKKGATTIWEHWDGIKDNGEFWSTDMNSFNHYAYGSVAEWVFCEAAGINITTDGITIEPHPDARLGHLNAEYDSRFGTIKSNWNYDGDTIIYNIEIPCKAFISIGDTKKYCEKGKYTFTV